LYALAGEARHHYNKTLLLLKIFVINIPLAYRNLPVKRPVLQQPVQPMVMNVMILRNME
jgi:hypothetical protein